MRTKIKWTWKKIVGIIAGLLGIGTLVSCYGMPVGYGSVFVGGTVTSEEDDSPIVGIHVDVADGYRTGGIYTDENGFYEILAEYDYYCEEDSGCTLRFTDEDGEENGGYFYSKELAVPKENDKTFENNVKLEKMIPITIEGTVKSEDDSTPIKNISVESEIEFTFTDKDGHYKIRTGARQGKRAHVHFSDEDGYSNGGWFESYYLEISLDKDNTTDNDVFLKKIEEDPEE